MGGIVVAGCLHTEAPVQLTNGRWKKAMDLAPGDHVLSYSTELGVHETEVLRDENRRLKAKRDFIRFRTQLGYEVIVTPEHGILTKSNDGLLRAWSIKAANDLNVNDFVPSLNGDKLMQQDRVISIETITDIGSVQPVTKSGTIIVSNVTVSCFDHFQPRSLSSLFEFFDVSRFFRRAEMFL